MAAATALHGEKTRPPKTRKCRTPAATGRPRPPSRSPRVIASPRRNRLADPGNGGGQAFTKDWHSVMPPPIPIHQFFGIAVLGWARRMDLRFSCRIRIGREAEFRARPERVPLETSADFGRDGIGIGERRRTRGRWSGGIRPRMLLATSDAPILPLLHRAIYLDKHRSALMLMSTKVPASRA